MATVWDFEAVSEQIVRGGGGYRVLSAATVVLCLSALSSMEGYNAWGELDDTDRDTLDAWLANASLELLNPYTCPGDDMQIATLTYEASAGSAGVAITADSERQVPLDTEYDPLGIVSLHGSNAILLDAGRWWVSGHCVIRDIGRLKSWLTGPGDARYCRGMNKDNDDGHCHISGIVEVDGETDLYWTVEGNATGTFGRSYDIGEPEVYAQISFIRMGDVD